MYKKDLMYTALNQLWRVIAGPMVLLFIPLYLTPIQQGYWYTFTSIAALAVFADLGFSMIILQFAAHEFAYLRFDENYKFCGDADHLWRLASFFRFSVRWLTKIVCIVFPLILVGGYFFLAAKAEQVEWQFAWVVYAVASACVFFYSSFLCFFEGCNSVSLVQSLRLKISICTSLVLLGGLFCGLHLYALAFSLVASSMAGFFLLLKRFWKAMQQLWHLSAKHCYDWWPEFSSLIWRYAISWCSGYFLFQLFTPLAFHFYGAELAGQVGISIAMWTAGFGIAMTCLTAINPQVNILVAERKWMELDQLFGRSMAGAMSIMALGGLAFFAIYFWFVDSVAFFQRILSVLPMGMLFVCWLLQLFVNGLALYLRAHKKEPLMQLSLVSAVYVAITTYLCARFLPVDWLFLGFFSSYLWGTPLVVRIWRRQRAEHNKG